MEIFGDRLLAAMLSAGLSTAPQLAKAGNVTRQTAIKWLEMEEAELAAKRLYPLADRLGVRARWLATGKGSLPGISELHWRVIADILAKLPPDRVDKWLRDGERMAS